MRRSVWLVGVFAAALLAADEQTTRLGAEAQIREVLEAFWQAFCRGDAAAFEREIDFPLTLQETSAGEERGERFVIDKANWSHYRRQFAAGPAEEEEVTVRLSNLRLEWLDRTTCLATYDLRAETTPAGFEGRFMALLADREGWRVAVATIPM